MFIVKWLVFVSLAAVVMALARRKRRRCLVVASAAAVALSSYARERRLSKSCYIMRIVIMVSAKETETRNNISERHVYGAIVATARKGRWSEHGHDYDAGWRRYCFSTIIERASQTSRHATTAVKYRLRQSTLLPAAIITCAFTPLYSFFFTVYRWLLSRHLPTLSMPRHTTTLLIVVALWRLLFKYGFIRAWIINILRTTQTVSRH